MCIKKVGVCGVSIILIGALATVCYLLKTKVPVETTDFEENETLETKGKDAKHGRDGQHQPLPESVE